MRQTQARPQMHVSLLYCAKFSIKSINVVQGGAVSIDHWHACICDAIVHILVWVQEKDHREHPITMH